MTGTVTYYDPVRYFGFLEDEVGKPHFFLYKKLKREKAYRYYSGDKVEFELTHSEKDPTKLIASITKHQENPNYQALLEEVEKNPRIIGYLKRFPDGRWAIKHMPSKIFIELRGPGPFEEDLEFIYEHRLNEMTEALVKINKKKEMTAVLADRRFSTAYQKALRLKESGETVIAKVTGQNKDVVFLEIIDPPIQATILKKKFVFDYGQIKKWQLIPVSIVIANENGISVAPILDYFFSV